MAETKTAARKSAKAPKGPAASTGKPGNAKGAAKSRGGKSAAK